MFIIFILVIDNKLHVEIISIKSMVFDMNLTFMIKVSRPLWTLGREYVCTSVSLRVWRACTCMHVCDGCACLCMSACMHEFI